MDYPITFLVGDLLIVLLPCIGATQVHDTAASTGDDVVLHRMRLLFAAVVTFLLLFGPGAKAGNTLLCPFQPFKAPHLIV